MEAESGQIKSILFGVDGVCGVFFGSFDGGNNLTGTVTLEDVTATSGNLIAGLAAAGNGNSIVQMEVAGDSMSVFIPSLSSAQSDLINDNIGDGNLYVEVETNVGTMRGPLQDADVVVAFTELLGSNSLDPVTTDATGSGHLSINSSTGEYSAVLQIVRNGTSDNITAAHIHLGSSTEAGDILVNLNNQGGDLWTARGTLTGDDLTAILSGGTYFNTHTDANPAGFLRGQIPAPQ